MADNFAVLDGSGASTTIKTTDNASVHTPHHNVDVIAGGASADIGAVADAAVITDTTGSLSGKLRGLVKWAFERMPAALGQGTMAQSLPVVIASNQTGVPLAASAAQIGAVKQDGPFNTPSQKFTTSPDMSGAAVDITTAPSSGKRIFIDDLIISVGATALEVTIKEETSGTVLLVVFVPANGTVVLSPRTRIIHNVSDKKVQAQTSASGPIRIFASYHSES